MALIPVSRSVGPISLSMPGLPAGVNYDYFFDRDTVKNALDDMTRKALYRGGSVVMQIARRSIKRQGMARPKLKVMTENPDSSIGDLIGMTEANGDRKNNRALRRRLMEIRARAPSQPGTPPHTHKGNLRDKPGIVFAYDSTSESVVVGQGEPGAAWLASLHEFGGREQMRGWAWIPRWPRSYRAGIIGYWRLDREPKNKDRWAATGFYENMPYPERPYMRPAFQKAIDSGRIAAEFANRFRVAGM